ncbi:MAG: FecCD family ABC transporter permease [Syntrophothermus sp.]
MEAGFHKQVTIGILAISLVLGMLLATATGTVQIGLYKVVQILWHRLPYLGEGPAARWSPTEEVITMAVRLPRVILAAVVGTALAAAGVVFQGLFRNPMADPYVVGVSAGAALGATVAISLRLNAQAGIYAVPFLAFIGALLTSQLVYLLAKVGNKVSVTSLLLAGIAVGSFLSAVVSLLMVLKNDGLQEIVFWMMGGFSARSWQHVYMALPYVLAGLAVIFAFRREMNLLLLGEETAQQLGVNVHRLQVVLLAAGSLVAAAAVSVSGIVGFVGLIVPHVMRLLVGADHRLLLPAAALAGGLFLLAADTLARIVLAPLEVPVGILTALTGAPFFLYLLRRSRTL